MKKPRVLRKPSDLAKCEGCGMEVVLDLEQMIEACPCCLNVKRV